MGTWVHAVILSLALFTLPSEQTWPAKGDTVHVAATFRDVDVKSPVAGILVKMTVKPCATLTILEANPAKPRWVAQYLTAPMESTLRLDGPWLARMHRTESDCSSQYATAGEPKVKGSGGSFKILPEDDR